MRSASTARISNTRLSSAPRFEQSVHVVADDKFFDASLATVLGVPVKNGGAPQQGLHPAISHARASATQYPMDWKGAIEYVGLPCVLKDAHGGGWRDVYVCRSLEEVLLHYNDSGLLTMVLQEFIEWTSTSAVSASDKRKYLPMQYDPKARR